MFNTPNRQYGDCSYGRVVRMRLWGEVVDSHISHAPQATSVSTTLTVWQLAAIKYATSGFLSTKYLRIYHFITFCRSLMVKAVHKKSTK